MQRTGPAASCAPTLGATELDLAGDITIPGVDYLELASGLAPGPSSGLELIQVAHIAAQVGRPEDAVQYLHQAASRLYESSPGVDFKGADRALMAKCLKLVVNPLRNTIRTLRSQSMKAPDSTSSKRLELLEDYRATKTDELLDTCTQVVQVMRDIVLPMASSAEARIFFNKLAADHSRYICEIALVDPTEDDLLERERAVEETEAFYQNAFDEAQSDLPPTHPLRLSLTLNFAIFYREIKFDQQLALEVARTAYDDAAAELGSDPIVFQDEDGANSTLEKTQQHHVQANMGQPTPANPHNMYASTIAADVGTEGSTVDAPQKETEALQVLRVIKTSLRRWSFEEHQSMFNE